MEPNSVIEALHELEDRLPGRGPRLETSEINAFALESSEERLGHGVIPTVTFAAHTNRDAHFREHRLIRGLNVFGELAIFSLVLTHRTLPPGIVSAYRHVERLAEQVDWILLSMLAR